MEQDAIKQAEERVKEMTLTELLDALQVHGFEENRANSFKESLTYAKIAGMIKREIENRFNNKGEN